MEVGEGRVEGEVGEGGAGAWVYWREGILDREGGEGRMRAVAMALSFFLALRSITGVVLLWKIGRAHV